jgi:hypothetical protein
VKDKYLKKEIHIPGLSIDLGKERGEKPDRLLAISEIAGR